MKNRKLLFWGYFWRYGVIFAMLIVSPLLAFIFVKINSLKAYAPTAFLFPFAIGALAMGISYIVAILFKKPFILLVNQSARHQKMDPKDLDWNDINKKEWIGIGIMFAFLGLATLTVAIIELSSVLNG